MRIACLVLDYLNRIHMALTGSDLLALMKSAGPDEGAT
jgi:hypothetical protein